MAQIAKPWSRPSVANGKSSFSAGSPIHFKAHFWTGEDLEPRFEIDFLAEGPGRPHLMRFGSRALHTN